MHTIQILFFLFMLSIHNFVWADHIKIRDAYIPEGPPVSRVLAGYMSIDNQSSDTCYIVHVSSKDFGAIEMHQTREVDGIARMFPQSQLVIPASVTLTLEPGSYHLMLFRPQKVFRKGDTSEFTFTLGNGETFTKTISVK